MQTRGDESFDRLAGILIKVRLRSAQFPEVSKGFASPLTMYGAAVVEHSLAVGARAAGRGSAGSVSGAVPARASPYDRGKPARALGVDPAELVGVDRRE